MKSIQNNFLRNLEKNFENWTNSYRTIVWVFQFNTQSVVIFIVDFLAERKFHVIKVNHQIK